MQSTMTTYTVEQESQEIQKSLELTILSRPTTTDRYSFIANGNVQLVGLAWDDYYEPYSPWTGLKTAVAIAVMLILFVMYILIRTRCHPACRHDVYVRLRRAVRSSTPSCLLSRLRVCDEDNSGNRCQLPITVETAEQCLRRVELELVEVVNDQKTEACSGRQPDEPDCDNVSPSSS